MGFRIGVPRPFKEGFGEEKGTGRAAGLWEGEARMGVVGFGVLVGLRRAEAGVGVKGLFSGTRLTRAETADLFPGYPVVCESGLGLALAAGRRRGLCPGVSVEL